MVDLVYCMEGCPLDMVHPLKRVADFGIQYNSAEPMPIASRWILRDCKNIPDDLPDYIWRIEDKV